MLIPLPSWVEPLRPDWVALILIYWCISLPVHTGLITGFIFGLVLDIAMGTLLGQHGLGLTLISFLALRNHQRFRIFPPIQQGFIVMIILLFKQLLFLWIYGMTKRAPDSLLLYFLSSVISMVLWPWISIVMREIQRRFLFSSH